MSNLLPNDLPLAPSGKMGWPWIAETDPLPALMPDGSPWPKITIVTPSYNQGEFIEETIRSVLLQGYPNLEYIVMDGGSTDESVEIIRQYEPWLAYWVSEKDKGQADAINKGWERANGDFMGWLNSDDLLTPGSLEAVAYYLAANPGLGYVFGDLERIDAHGRQVDLTTYRDFDLVEMVKRAGWISQPGSLLSRKVFEQIGPLDASLHFMLDMDLWLRAGLVSRFGYLRRPLARFRRHEDAKTSTRQDLAAQDILTVYRKLFSRPDLPIELRRVEKQAISSAHLYAARRWRVAGKLSEAWRNALNAACSFPRIVGNLRYWQFLCSLVIAPAVGGIRSRGFSFFLQITRPLRGQV